MGIYYLPSNLINEGCMVSTVPWHLSKHLRILSSDKTPSLNIPLKYFSFFLFRLYSYSLSRGDCVRAGACWANVGYEWEINSVSRMAFLQWKSSFIFFFRKVMFQPNRNYLYIWFNLRITIRDMPRSYWGVRESSFSPARAERTWDMSER